MRIVFGNPKLYKKIIVFRYQETLPLEASLRGLSMTLTSSNRWAASGAVAGAALIIFNPMTYWLTDTIFLGREYVAGSKGRCPTYFGYFLHVVVLFFAVFGLLCISWACT